MSQPSSEQCPKCGAWLVPSDHASAFSAHACQPSSEHEQRVSDERVKALAETLSWGSAMDMTRRIGPEIAADLINALRDLISCRAALAESQAQYEAQRQFYEGLQQQHDALRSAMNDYTICYHCGARFPNAEGEHHGATCEKHPMRATEQALASLRRQVGEALKDAHMWMAALCGRMHADESCHPKALKNAQDATEKVRILLVAMEREAASGGGA
jgi:DNA-directed RNA polymerase subunit M/transcription elongation factor TFIIS